MSLENGEFPRLFLEELRPRTYKKSISVKSHLALDGIQNDQEFSPLQAHIDQESSVTDERMRILAKHMHEGDEDAKAEFIEASLKIIRHVVRKLNIGIHLNEDELINAAVVRILEQLHYLTPDIDQKLTTRVGDLAAWAVLKQLDGFIAHTKLPVHVVEDLNRLRIQTASSPSGEAVGDIAVPQTTTDAESLTKAMQIIGAVPLSDLVEIADIEQHYDGAVERVSDHVEFISLVDNLDLVISAIDKKPSNLDRDIEMLLLYFFEEETLHEIGDRFGISREAVRLAINRIIKYLGRVNLTDKPIEEARQYMETDDKIPRRYNTPKSKLAQVEVSNAPAG